VRRTPALKVKSRNSVFRYKGKDEDMQKTGNELGVFSPVPTKIRGLGSGIVEHLRIC
jgi:TolB-like protein